MRGKPFCGIGIYSADRITPADAGKTVVFLFYTTMCRDHPRGCGENPVSEVLEPPFLGSPPRMRGKPMLLISLPPEVGITPADAGKTLTAYKSSSSYQDHPRGCGENVTA